VAEGAQYDLEQRKEIMARYAELMHKNGFAGPFKHIVSADMSTAGLSDAYVERFHKLDEDEPLWRAAAAAKSPNYGGLRMRGPITGEGLTAALVEAMHDKGEDAARLTFMGFGQVAAWAARYAKTQQETDLSIMGITDVDGMVTTRDRRGLPITAEMVQQIGDNPSFMGRKMAALHDALHRNGFRADFAPDNTGIFFVPTDYFVPAAGGDVIDLAVAKKLAAERGVIEGANGATSPAAHKYMVKKGLMVLPDILANRQGVNTSEVEWALNIGGEAPDEKAIRGAALEDSREQVREAFDVAKRLGTYDIRIATSAIHLQCLMGHTGLAA
jgi:glutamate dehydrogenase/leucine dehydrogenase